jgi:hypothetical protein
MTDTENGTPFRVDPARRDRHNSTGFYVRAKDGDNWASANIAELDADSLYRFLRSRGGDNRWAESVVFGLLDHDYLALPLAASPEAEPIEGDAHVHEWEVEYLPDPMSAGGVVRSGDLRCSCGEVTTDD